MDGRDGTEAVLAWQKKQMCADCNPCPHGKLKKNCAACTPCPHGKVKHNCTDCSPCPHGKRETHCAACTPCYHGKVKRLCVSAPLALTATENQLQGVQSGTRGSAEFEADQARAGEFARDQTGAEMKQEPEIKQEPEPFTIQSYFGFDTGQ